MDRSSLCRRRQKNILLIKKVVQWELYFAYEPEGDFCGLWKTNAIAFGLRIPVNRIIMIVRQVFYDGPYFFLNMTCRVFVLAILLFFIFRGLEKIKSFVKFFIFDSA